ncbi:GGDEF domain-containing protein [Alcaligenaceae bacterium]|nr:GGDEF domain-containing protein [Alcaligenaceae bacterium]
MHLTDTQILTLGSPAVSILFSFGFVLVWNYGRRRAQYLLLISASFFVYALAAISQILYIPRDSGLNALFSGGLFLFSLLLLSSGVTKRYRAHFDGVLHGLAVIATLLALAYFYYEQPDVVVRIYVLNFSVAGMVLLSAFRIRTISRGALIDRTFFWVYLLFGISFIVRTSLSVTKAVSNGASAFLASPFWLALQMSLLLFAILLAMVLLAAAMLDIISVLQHDRNIDDLTKLHNRRSFEERSLRKLVAHRNESICLVLCDLDHFKVINDSFGHHAGDMVLMECGNIIRRCIRKNDIAGRFGGEEFVVLMPNTSLAGAARLADRIRAELADANFPAMTGVHPVTASFGVAELLPNESLSDLFRRTDTMLYAAKKEGRNRVMLDGAGTVSGHIEEDANDVVPLST